MSTDCSSNRCAEIRFVSPTNSAPLLVNCFILARSLQLFWLVMSTTYEHKWSLVAIPFRYWAKSSTPLSENVFRLQRLLAAPPYSRYCRKSSIRWEWDWLLWIRTHIDPRRVHKCETQSRFGEVLPPAPCNTPRKRYTQRKMLHRNSRCGCPW